MQRILTHAKNTVLGLLIVLFFSNVTFALSIDFHMCQGEFQSLAFFGQKASCSKMIEAKVEPRSCCDPIKPINGLHFKQKSCCDNLVVSQQNLLDKPSVDLENTSSISHDFIADFGPFQAVSTHTIEVQLKEEIPPPPNLFRQHSQENLQVFLI